MHTFLRHVTPPLSILALTLATSVAAAGSPALDQLLDNAEYWSKRGQMERAVEAWHKVLRSDPSHPRALTALGLFYARKGEVSEAERYAERLRAAHPSDAGIEAIRRAARVGARYDELIAEARALAQRGSAEAAVAKYREAFGATPPPALALEFYETLGGTKDGWAQAREGLEALAAARPRSNEVRMALARHLTYREPTRREGIGRLFALAQSAELKPAARASLEKALLWLEAARSDAKLFRDYLETFGEDERIRQRLAALNDTSRERLEQAFEAIEDKRLERAESALSQAIKQRGRDVGAVVGLGLVALERSDFPKAIALFEEAKALAPDRPQMWERSLASARFWAKARQAETLGKEGRRAEAEKLLEEAAAAASGGERGHAELMLARLEMDDGRWEAAEARLRALLETQPEHPEAARTLVKLLVRTDRMLEATALNERLAERDPAAAEDPRALQAEALRLKAVLQREAGELETAKELLREAVALDPSGVWPLLELVYVGLERGELDEARESLGLLLTRAPEAPDAQIARAHVLEEEGRFAEALEAVLSLQGRGDAAPLTRRLELRRDVARAVDGALRGNRLSGRMLLLELGKRHEKDPRLLGFVALGFSALGEVDHALALFTEALARAKERVPGLELQLASALLAADRDVELLEVLRRLAAAEALSSRERRDLRRLRVAYAVRKADRLREAGELARAVSFLAPVLREYPEEAQLLSALGRISSQGGEHADAHALFLRARERDPRDLDALEGAVMSAVAGGDHDGARRLVEESLGADDAHPRRQLIAGRYAVRVGDDAAAMSYLRRALELAESPMSPRVGGGGEKRSGAGGDPLLAGAFGRLARAEGGAGSGGHGLRGEIEAEIEEVKKRHHIELSARGSVRHRVGEAGLSALTAVEARTSVSAPIGYRARVELVVTPVLLEAGRAALDDPGVRARFGTGVLLPAQELAPIDARTRGAALELGLRYRSCEAAVGSTPLGFAVQSFTGRAGCRFQLGAFGIAAEVSRRAVTDSVLSYAGVVDPASGETWGGVVAEGGRLDLGYLARDVTLYAWGGFDWIRGHNVPDNTALRGGAGALWHVARTKDSELTTGLAGTYLGFERNLRYFTFGHGGYFSPQSFIHLGVPVEWKGTSDRFTWSLRGEPGLNGFRERGEDWLPTDAGRQAALVADGLDPRYAGGERFGFAFDAVLSSTYDVGRGFGLGVELRYHTAEDYREMVGGVFLRHAFRGDERPSLERAVREVTP